MSEQTNTDVESTPLPSEPTTAVEPGEQPEKITFNDDQQKVFNDAVGKKAFEVREQKRENEALRKQIEEANAKIPQQVRPDDPDVVDQYSENYIGDNAARDQILREQGAFENAEKFRNEQTLQAQQQQQAQAHQAQAESIHAYTEKATAAGIPPAVLQNANTIVASSGLGDDVLRHIIDDDSGGQIMTYLAEHQQELLDLRALTPMQISAHIAQTIKPKATATGKQSLAPEPTELLQGGGAPPGKRGPAGATFT